MRAIYDDEAVYLGFECTQTKTPIVGFLTRRDEDSESEWVSVFIDSRRDARTAYFFAVNVKGVIADGIMHDGTKMNYEWDENWEARAALTPTGWSAEMRIPLRVLRFTPDLPVQSWGLSVSRFFALAQEKVDWPHIPRDVAAPIPFFGRLDDLRDLRRGGAVELRPFAIEQVRHRTPDAAVIANGFDGGIPSAGLDLKLHLTQTLTLDAAINPQFGEIDPDQLIQNLNNYEIQLPEKRPLFLEGADLFATPLGIFYSRRIGSSPLTPALRSGTGGVQPADGRLVDVPGAATIYAATKIAGRVWDSWTVGLLSALASRNEYEVQLPSLLRERRTVEPLTAFNVLRLRGEVGDRAQIGVIGTATTRFEQTGGDRVCPTGEMAVAGTRCFRDSAVAGLDAIWRSPTAAYVASGQLVGSAVNSGLPEVQLDGTSIGSGARGTGGWLRVAKEGGRHFLTEFVYTGIGRKLTYNDLGFMPRQNLHETKAGFELRSLDPGALTLERHLRLDLSLRRNLDGLDLGTTAELGFRVRLQGFWNVSVATMLAPSRFDDRETGDGSALQRVFYAGGKAEVSSDPRRVFGGGLKGEVRFFDAGMGADLEMPLVLRALPQLQIELKPQFGYNSGEQRVAWNSLLSGDPARYVFGRQLARTLGAVFKVSYAFTPRLSLQTYAQLFLAAEHYTDFREAPRLPGSRIPIAALLPLTVAPPTDADLQQAALNVNVVLRWEYRLGSTLFVVYSRSQLPGIVDLMGTTATLRPSAIRNVAAVDTLLVKLSYWWGS